MLLETLRPKIWFSAKSTELWENTSLLPKQTQQPPFRTKKSLLNCSSLRLSSFFDVPPNPNQRSHRPNIVFVRQKEVKNVPASCERVPFVRVWPTVDLLAYVSYLKPSVFFDRFLSQTNCEGLWLAAESKVKIRLTFKNVLFGPLQLHMGSLVRRFCKGSPGRERALPLDQGEHLLLVSADFFLHNAEVQVQTCCCIPAERFDTFTTVLSGQRRTPPPSRSLLRPLDGELCLIRNVGRPWRS